LEERILLEERIRGSVHHNAGVLVKAGAPHETWNHIKARRDESTAAMRAADPTMWRHFWFIGIYRFATREEYINMPTRSTGSSGTGDRGLKRNWSTKFVILNLCAYLISTFLTNQSKPFCVGNIKFIITVL